MSGPKPIIVGLEASCLLARPLTGVGYYTQNLFQALAAGHPEFQLRLFACAARPDRTALDGLASAQTRVLPCPTRIKNALWTRVGWPPIEYFTGQVDIAHGCFHLVPPSRGRRLVTIFDLAALRVPGTRSSRSAAMHRRLLAHAAKHAEAFIVLSESGKADLGELLGVPAERVYVVPGGVDISEFDAPHDAPRLGALRARWNLPDGYWIHLGTLEPRKNLPRLLEAYARVRRRRECPPLLLAGARGWTDSPIFEAIARLGLGEAVRHAGYLPREDAVTLLRGARACLYPSRYEGFGLPVLEAMAAGTPVLTSNVSSLPEVIGGTGLQVDPDDTDAIADGLESLLDAPEAARERAEAARIRAAEFTWANSAAKLAACYHALAGR